MRRLARAVRRREWRREPAGFSSPERDRRCPSLAPRIVARPWWDRIFYLGVALATLNAPDPAGGSMAGPRHLPMVRRDTHLTARFRVSFVVGLLGIAAILARGAQQTGSTETAFRQRPARVLPETTSGAAVLVPN